MEQASNIGLLLKMTRSSEGLLSRFLRSRPRWRRIWISHHKIVLISRYNIGAFLFGSVNSESLAQWYILFDAADYPYPSYMCTLALNWRHHHISVKINVRSAAQDSERRQVCGGSRSVQAAKCRIDFE